MSRNDKYIAPFCMGGVGLLCLASPLFLNLGTQMPAYIQSQEIAAKQDVERKELEQRKKTNDQIRDTGLPIATPTLTVTNWLHKPGIKPPKLADAVLNRYSVSGAVVFDAAEKCIGRIENGKFIPIQVNKKVCEELPNGTGQ